MKKNSIILLALILFNASLVSKHLTPCNPREHVTNTNNSELYASVLAADNIFVKTYKAQPDMFAKDKAIVLTCMDPRLLPNEFMGFFAGDMYVLRNAGGLATADMLRSLIIAIKLLGAEQIFVVQHTDCGMQKFTNKIMTHLLEGTIVTAKLVHPCEVTVEPVRCKWKNTSKCCGKKSCVDYDYVDWRAIRVDLFKSVKRTVKAIREYPLIPSDIPIYGFIFDVITGELIPVPKANKAGKATPLVCKK